MPSDHSLPEVLDRIYHNQLALEAALMALTLWGRAAGLSRGGQQCARSPLRNRGKRRLHQTGPAPLQEYRLEVAADTNFLQ